MKIGLVRHFKVNHPFPKKRLLTKKEVIEWFSGYDRTENIQYKDVDLSSVNWQRCYASPMIRALNTAAHIYHGHIEQVTGLKELDILHRLPGKFRLPFLLWATIVRIKSFSANSDTQRFQTQIIAFLDSIMAQDPQDTLVVSHWFVMRIMRKELIKRGFIGKKFRSNEYATLYIFEKKGH
ncbi:MAG: hypothetical protein EOO90_03450 [Pedobacter sp.]|nr:MAG: hypothetical protein EOO90_03450 [Pedobacter sp.]